MKILFSILIVIATCTQCQSTLSKNEFQQRPKLVVGIVVDQMRYDYLIKFYNKYSDGGFRRLMANGYHLENVHFNYIPTYTAVGHASIYTGTSPVNHGIVGNYWYDKSEHKSVYCVDDAAFNTVGAETGGKKSPHRMLTTNIADALKLAQNMKNKTIAISIKDRGAIIPGGHTADAAYWFEGNHIGKFISSTFYLNELPPWVNDYNNSGQANEYLNKIWDTYYKINTYTESLPDQNDYEGPFKGKLNPTFPYNLNELRKDNNNYDLLKAVPFGNSIITEFSQAAILGEQLGKSDYTDFLAISYSSPDYIGHQFGPSSKEIEDTYIRLDLEIEQLLAFLDKEVGATNYTLFLSADHAVAEVPAYLNSLKIPGGYFDADAFEKYVNDITFSYFNTTELVENISNDQIFLSKEILNKLKLNRTVVSKIIADEIINFKSVYKSVSASTLQTTSFDSGILHTLQNGYNQKISGDVLYIPKPATIKYSKTGSTHGSGYIYDTHVPLIFYGNGIKKGASDTYYTITDIAPTLASFLNITNPNGCTGRTIIEVLK